MPKPIGHIDDYPASLDLKESHLPQITDWEVGKKYKIILEVEMTGINKGYDGKGPIRGSFIVKNAKSAGEAKGGSDDAPAPRTAKLDALKNKAVKA